MSRVQQAETVCGDTCGRSGENEKALPSQPEDTQSSSPDTPELIPSIETVQRDVALANQYRLELIKTTMTLSMGLFAFTVAFPAGRNITEPIIYSWLVGLSWGALGLSICAGLFHLRVWEMLYMSYRQMDWKDQRRGSGKTYRRQITRWRRLFMVLQYLGFVVGVASVGIFAILNIRH